MGDKILDLIEDISSHVFLMCCHSLAIGELVSFPLLRLSWPVRLGPAAPVMAGQADSPVLILRPSPGPRDAAAYALGRPSLRANARELTSQTHPEEALPS